MKKDLNNIAKIEKAIEQKYGKEAIANPKKHWDEEKEKKYLEDLKAFYKKSNKNKKVKKFNGFTIKEKESTWRNKAERNCPVCNAYSFLKKDDLYMNKFECCFDCYIQYVEGREERWKTGWRPNG